MEKIIYVTYEEARRLQPFFEYAKIHGPYKEARGSAARILRELGNVRQIDYSPTRGYQMFLKEDDYEFFLDGLHAMEGK